MIEEIEVYGGGENLVSQGNTLQKTQTQFTQAVAIQKPRRRLDIIKACEEESAIAGNDFYYSWTVKGDKGSKLVEGLSISAALAAARNWGNCAIPVEVVEDDEKYTFTATFLDMETGFNLQRVFRQRKTQRIGKNYDLQRSEDIVFQIGQSKALRNVILNALPSWLLNKMLEKAKENVIGKIMKMGLDVARKKAIEFFGKYAITPERIENKINKKADRWDAEDLALLQGAMNSLLNGQESANSLFPEDTIAKDEPQTKLDTVKPISTEDKKPKLSADNFIAALKTCKTRISLNQSWNEFWSEGYTDEEKATLIEWKEKLSGDLKK